ncbi:hypothetical protein GGR51DRAFT_538887 [Nemania sp. FL0031]|nr:hypothetical protein GGR51DRAFT_538887 [Nemania sp. FL0031]
MALVDRCDACYKLISSPERLQDAVYSYDFFSSRDGFHLMDYYNYDSLHDADGFDKRCVDENCVPRTRYLAINMPDAKGRVPLHLALSENGSEVVAEYLIHSKANLISRDEEGKSALGHWVVAKKKCPIVLKLLLDGYADRSKYLTEDELALTLKLAVGSYDESVVRSLLSHVANSGKEVKRFNPQFYSEFVA